MGKVLRDIYIILDKGVVIFKRVFNEKMDAQLFGAFLSALNTFAGEINEKGLSKFEIGIYKYILKRNKDLIFVANYAETTTAETAERELENVAKRFMENYSFEVIEKWDGNLVFFENFSKVIEESMETPFEKLKKSFW